MIQLSDDLLSGVAAIAAFRGESKRRTYYLLERKLIPGFKVGNRWNARKSTLMRQIVDLEEQTDV